MSLAISRNLRTSPLSRAADRNRLTDQEDDMTFRSSYVVFAMAAALWPQVAAAQAASSFAELRARVKDGQTLIVTGSQGGQIKGVLRSLSGDTLVLDAEGSRMSFAQSEVRKIRSPSHRGRNAAIGAGIGFAVASIGIRGNKGSDSVYMWLYVGSWLLPASGASVGAATGGSQTLFLPAGRVTRGVSISPWLAPNGAGLALAVRY
jgi:hypothetical protein